MATFGRFLWSVAVISCVLWGFKALPQPIATQLWYHQLEGGVWSVAESDDITGDGIADAVTGDAFNVISCIDGGDGSLIWSYATQGDIWSLSSIQDLDGDGYRDVVAGTAYNEVLCLSGNERDQRELLWRYETDGDVWQVGTMEDVTGDGTPEILLGTADNRVLCLDAIEKEKVWSFPTGGDVWCVATVPSISVGGGQDVLAGSADNKVYRLNGATGVEIWSSDMLGDVWSVISIGDVSDDGRDDLVVGTAYNEVVCLSGVGVGRRGLKLWSFPTGGDVWCLAPLAGDGAGEPDSVVAGTADNSIYRLDARTGELLSSFTTCADIKHVMTVPDLDADGVHEVVCGTTVGITYCLSGANIESRIWFHVAEGEVLSLCCLRDEVSGSQRIISGSNDNLAYCLGLALPVRYLTLKSIEFTGTGEVSLRWDTDYGVAYQLQYLDGALGGLNEWTDLGQAITGDCDDKVFLDSGDTDRLSPESESVAVRFYRLKVMEL